MNMQEVILPVDDTLQEKSASNVDKSYQKKKMIYANSQQKENMKWPIQKAEKGLHAVVLTYHICCEICVSKFMRKDAASLISTYGIQDTKVNPNLKYAMNIHIYFITGYCSRFFQEDHRAPHRWGTERRWQRKVGSMLGLLEVERCDGGQVWFFFISVDAIRLVEFSYLQFLTYLYHLNRLL